ncbi:MAG: hypothetical protein QW806_03380 [Nitrososphaerota archaeon]
MKKSIVYSALLLIIFIIIVAFILFFYKKPELELKPELEMEYLGRKIDTTGWISANPSSMGFSMLISKDNFNVKPGDEIEIKIHAWIFQHVKGETKIFTFEIYKESSKIGEFSFPIEHEGIYYEGAFKLIIKAPSIEGEYNYSIVWMKDVRANFKIIVKK